MTLGTGIGLDAIAAVFELDRQTVTLESIPKNLLILGDRDVIAAWSVTGFATDTDFVVGCVILIRRRIILALQIS